MQGHAKWAAALALLVLVTGSPAAQASKWTTTRFEVFAGAPSEKHRADNRTTLVEPDHPRGGVDDKDKVELERFLHKVALDYESMGFPDPIAAGLLEPLVRGDDGQPAIRVYLYPFDGPFGGYANRCDGPDTRTVIHINQTKLHRDGSISDITYQTLAHELFHAVQWSSPFLQVPAPCGVGKWIREGTADAIGFDIARKVLGRKLDQMNEVVPLPRDFFEWLKSVPPKMSPAFLKPWGGRSYTAPLADPDVPELDVYLTSSFWRHLAELTYSKKHNTPLAGPADPGNQVDYSYLTELFSTRAKGLGAKNEIVWLESWMASSPSLPAGNDKLADVFPVLISSLADHMAPGMRIPTIRNLDTSERAKKWQDRLFNCRDVTLSPNQPTAKLVSLPLRWTAAGCVRVKLEGLSGAVEIAVQVADVPYEKLHHLRAGVPGGQLIATPYAINPTTGGNAYALWRVQASANGSPAVILFSNVRDKAVETPGSHPNIYLSLPGWTKGGQSTTGIKTASSNKPVTTTKQVKDIETAKRRQPTRQSALAAMGGRKKCRSSSCKEEMRIALGVDAGGLVDPALVAGTGGMMAKLSGTTSVGADAPNLTSLMAMTDDGRVETVNISFKAVEHGTNIQIDDALIKVPKPRDMYSSREQVPDAHGDYKPNGKVFIDEYTPVMLRGRFEAKLVSFADQKKTSTRSHLPIRESISGTFVIAAPWRVEVEADKKALVKQLAGESAGDVVRMLERLPAGMRKKKFGKPKQVAKLCQLGITDDQLRKLDLPGSCSGASSTTVSDCRCTCKKKRIEEARPECQAVCEESWKSCPPEDKATDAETAEYRARMEKRGVDPRIIEEMIRVFKEADRQVRDLLMQQVDNMPPARRR